MFSRIFGKSLPGPTPDQDATNLEPFTQGNNAEITAAAYEPRFSLIAFGNADGRLFAMNKRNAIVASRVTANAPICALYSCPNSSSFVSLFSQYTYKHHPNLLEKRQNDPEKTTLESAGSKFKGSILAHWIVTPERAVPKIISFKEDIISIAISPSTPNFLIILQEKGSLLGFSLEKMNYTELYINQFEKMPCRAISCPRGMKYYIAHDKIDCVDISSMELDTYGSLKVSSMDMFDDVAAVIGQNGFPQLIKGSKVLKEIKLQKGQTATMSQYIGNDKWICVIRTEKGDEVFIDGKKVPNIPENTHFVPSTIINYQSFFERNNALFIKLITDDGRIFTFHDDSSISQPIFPPSIEAAAVFQDGGRILVCERKIVDAEIEVDVPIQQEQVTEATTQPKETEQAPIPVPAAPEEEKSKKEKKKEEKEKKKEEKEKKKEEKQKAKEEKERLKKEEKERKKAEKEKKKEDKNKPATEEPPKEEKPETQKEITEENAAQKEEKKEEKPLEEKKEETPQPAEQKAESPKKATQEQPPQSPKEEPKAPQTRKEKRIVKQERFILHSFTKNSYITSKEFQLPLPSLYCNGFLVCFSNQSVDVVDSLTGNVTKCLDKHVSRYYEINKKLYILDEEGNQFTLQDSGKLLELKEEKDKIPFTKYQKGDVFGIRKVGLNDYIYFTTKRTALYKESEIEIYEDKENALFYELVNENGCVYSPPSEENPEAQKQETLLPVYLLIITNKNIYLYDVFDQLKRIRKMKVDDEPIEATVFEWGGMILRMSSSVTIYPLPDFTLSNLGTLKLSGSANTCLIKKHGLFVSEADGTTMIYSNNHTIPMLFRENTPTIEEPTKKSFFGLVAKAAPNQQEADSSFGFTRPKSSIQQTTEVMQQLLVTAMERTEQLNEIEMKANRLYEHARQFHEATKKFRR